ncbi:MAG: lipocalin family protein [Verrucomicrobiae bacterium]|nr:lipocalin family protein [Verrucomicrobiae bacterium]
MLSSLAAISAGLISSCATSSKPLSTVGKVDLDRFMGTWYVIGYTPLGVDDDAHNAIEHYHLADNGDIETTYQFRKGSFDGELKTMTPVGRVHDEETNAEWRMQFIWPFKAEYYIFDLSPDYQRTIIAHPNRKYAWIMARSPQISTRAYDSALSKLETAGFDRKIIQKLPQEWSNESSRLKMIREAGKGTLKTE